MSKGSDAIKHMSSYLLRILQGQPHLSALPFQVGDNLLTTSLTNVRSIVGNRKCIRIFISPELPCAPSAWHTAELHGSVARTGERLPLWVSECREESIPFG